MNEKWQSNNKAYAKMVQRHLPFWNFLTDFIKDKNIYSIVDVGGGSAYAQTLLSSTARYALFDMNEKMIEQCDATYKFHGNFLEADISQVVGYHLVLCLSVVEHAMTLEPFIKKALEVKPRFVLISFFRGLEKREGLQSARQGCLHRRYSREEVEITAQQLNLEKYSIFTLKNDKLYPKYTTFDGLLLIENE